ncbi:MAG: tRNA glutamyl-Q(34) synthetase GluQRS [SAR86 cluster bacterium]|uniref:Glutamyl-Q tRNA(Asp) synthetase n=1 Tax=SAR86 cluster bacterium TaxID=2030880 RepID=A0A2A5B3D9_9GAMM|nr:MAG: tRNA glutamyl-Q(34) synthetase GluQRS [SAR86 cluster bacterium]
MSNSSPASQTSNYIGRFAPSPTGALHAGSLLAAVASYLDAKSNQGKWLLRMEDLDPPREIAGAANQILQQLNSLGLEWDGEVLYQSTRLDAYELILQQLSNKDLCYRCDCTRPQIRAMGNVYNGACRQRSNAPENEYAIRVKTADVDIGIDDLVQGHYQQNIGKDIGDFVIRRKDRLFAYQLAVVVDDDYQKVTHIIRGFDLIDSTPRQISLQRLLGFSTPNYGHIPVIINDQGQKLSKQHFAPAIDSNNASQLIFLALQALGQSPPANSQQESAQDQLSWAIQHWDIQAVPKLANIPDTTIQDSTISDTTQI